MFQNHNISPAEHYLQFQVLRTRVTNWQSGTDGTSQWVHSSRIRFSMIKYGGLRKIHHIQITG